MVGRHRLESRPDPRAAEIALTMAGGVFVVLALGAAALSTVSDLPWWSAAVLVAVGGLLAVGAKLGADQRALPDRWPMWTSALRLARFRAIAGRGRE